MSDLSYDLLQAAAGFDSNDQEIQALQDVAQTAIALLTPEQLQKFRQDNDIAAILNGTAVYNPF